MANRVGIRNRSRSQTGPRGLPGRIVGTLFFGVFLAAGLFFTYLVSQQVGRQVESWNWDPVPARILESGFVIDDSRNRPYRFEVRFEYAHGGTDYRSNTLSPDGGGWTNDFRQVQQLLVAYPEGAEVSAWMDPQSPGRAALKQGSKWGVAVVGLPLIFAVIGAVGLVATWVRGERTAISDAAMSSRAGPHRSGRPAMVLLFSLFTVIGGAATWFLGASPIWRVYQASRWPATPATVERSELLRFSDSDGTTYRVDILYRYEVDGEVYRSNAYDFVNASSSGRAGKLDLLADYPVGRGTVCYIDPADPTLAVLNPRPGASLLLGLIPAVFLLVGVGGLIMTLRPRRGSESQPLFPSAARSTATPRGSTRSTPPASGDADGATTLASGSSRRTKCLVLSFVALVWTGITAGFAVLLYRDGEWLGLAFLSLFALVGVGLIGAAFHQFLALFNPHVRVTLPTPRLVLGGTYTLEWELTGNVGRLADFALTLEGAERATYRQGTDTRTDTHTFRTFDLVRTDDRARIMDGRGRVEVTIPVDTMHTFAARHNEIRWTLKARGTIRRWPDVCDEWAVELAPPLPPAGKGGVV